MYIRSCAEATEEAEADEEAARLAAEAEAVQVARLAAEVEEAGEAAAASDSLRSSRGTAAAAGAATADQPCVDCAGFSEKAECRAWADAGECGANAAFMRDTCRKSCGMCCAQAEQEHTEL